MRVDLRGRPPLLPLERQGEHGVDVARQARHAVADEPLAVGLGQVAEAGVVGEEPELRHHPRIAQAAHPVVVHAPAREVEARLVVGRGRALPRRRRDPVVVPPVRQIDVHLVERHATMALEHRLPVGLAELLREQRVRKTDPRRRHLVEELGEQVDRRAGAVLEAARVLRVLHDRPGGEHPRQPARRSRRCPTGRRAPAGCSSCASSRCRSRRRTPAPSRRLPTIPPAPSPSKKPSTLRVRPEGAVTSAATDTSTNGFGEPAPPSYGLLAWIVISAVSKRATAAMPGSDDATRKKTVRTTQRERFAMSAGACNPRAVVLQLLANSAQSTLK